MLVKGAAPGLDQTSRPPLSLSPPSLFKAPTSRCLATSELCWLTSD